MQLPIVLDAINEGYPRCIIRQTIQGFFCEYGKWNNMRVPIGVFRIVNKRGDIKNRLTFTQETKNWE